MSTILGGIGEVNFTTKESKNIKVSDESVPHTSIVHSYIKDSLVEEKPDENSTPLKKKPRYIQLYHRKKSSRDSLPVEKNDESKKVKKKLTIKVNFVEVVEIESFKTYNERMTYTDYFFTPEEDLAQQKSFCKSFSLCAKKLCIIF